MPPSNPPASQPPPPQPPPPPPPPSPTGQGAPRPGVLEAVLLLLWALVAQVFVFGPAIALGVMDLESGGPEIVLISIVAQAVVFAGALLWLGIRGRLGGGHVGQFHLTGRALLLGLGAGLAGYVLITILVNVGTQIFGPVEAPEQRLLQDVVAGGITTLLVLFAAVVMAPLWEELLFRGVLFRALDQRIGVLPAALVSGIVFAIVHMEVRQPLYLGGLVVLGVLFAVLLRRTNNLFVPMVAHGTFNGVVLTMAIMAGREGLL